MNNENLENGRADKRPPRPETFNSNLDKLPPALAHLRDKKIWVCWCWYWNDKKWTKPPRRVDNPSRNASSSDPSTWGSHAQAVKQVLAGKADGIGIALQGCNVAAVDLDHCCDVETAETIDDIATWAKEYVDQFPDAYIEVTVSGTGLRILGTSELENFAPKFRLPGQGNGAAVELFSGSNHYLTVSGNEQSDCKELPAIGDRLKRIAEKLGRKNDTAPADAAHVEDVPPLAPTNGSEEVQPGAAAEPWSYAADTRLRSALRAIPTDEKVLAEKFGVSHETWIKIGRAIERLDWGERGYAIWRDWSAQNGREFNEKGLRAQWASFNRARNARDNPVTVGTVYYLAQQCGWVEPAKIEDNPTPPFQWLDMSNWDREPVPEREWAILNRVPLKQAGLFSGEGGTGKSITELMKDVAHVAGKDWFGSMPTLGGAFYVGAEDDEKELHIRLAAIAEHYGVTFDELIRDGLKVLCLLGKDATLCAATGKGGKVEVTALYRQLYEAAGDLKPKNISIDTLSRAFAGSEIDRVQVYAFAQHMQALAMVAGGSVTVLSHPSLQGIASGSGISGSTAWHGAFRFRQYLKGVKPENGEQADNNLRELEFKKNQYGPIGEKIVVQYRQGLFLPVEGVTSLGSGSTRG